MIFIMFLVHLRMDKIFFKEFVWVWLKEARVKFESSIFIRVKGYFECLDSKSLKVSRRREVRLKGFNSPKEGHEKGLRLSLRFNHFEGEDKGCVLSDGTWCKSTIYSVSVYVSVL